MSKVSLTRDQLYERVWSQPTTKVAAEFGLSDVAVKKMCRAMSIPTPRRGYWARLAAGQKVDKTPLPKLGAKVTPPPAKQIDPEANAVRRQEWQRNETLPAQGEDGRLDLPGGDVIRLHPQARAVYAALNKGKPDHHGLVRLSSSDLPYVEVTKDCADRAARVLHVVFSELESRGAEIKPVKHYNHNCLGFAHGEDTMTILIEEPLANIRREPTPEDLRRPSSEWRLETTKPGGQLRVSLHGIESTWSTDRMFRRNEGPRRPIEVLLYQVVETAWGFFVRKEESRQRAKDDAIAREKAEVARRAAEEEQRKLDDERRRIEAERKAEEDARRKEVERLAAHERAVASLAGARVENLLRAAEWWRVQRSVLDYLGACELHWAGGPPTPEALTDDQKKWLEWANAEAEAMSPFTAGYPDCEQDRALNFADIPVGGPYPSYRELPLPPTMQAPTKQQVAPDPAPEKMARPTPETPSSSAPVKPDVPPVYVKPQFPFWLLHQRRR